MQQPKTGVLKSDAEFVTRKSPAVGGNKGGAIEIVVKPGDIKHSGHSSQ